MSRKLNKSGIRGTILVDLSKAYNCQPHDLLAAKCEEYSTDKTDLYLIYKYLSNRNQ